MILESSAMLCLAHTVCGGDTKPSYFYCGRGFLNHPCSRWTRQSRQNYLWLARHNIALCDEYTFRYGKVHKIRKEKLDDWLFNNIPNITDENLTPFAEATGDIHEINGIETYRKYYLIMKKHLFVWTKREPPYWVKDNYLITNINEKWKIY